MFHRRMDKRSFGWNPLSKRLEIMDFQSQLFQSYKELLRIEKMKSLKHGKSISGVEVSLINSLGIWIDVQGTEYFLPYDEYPWFIEAKVKDILNVQLYHDAHLHWPTLDVDLEVESLGQGEKYPLIYKP